MSAIEVSSLDLARVAHCLLLAKADGVEPFQVAARLYGARRHERIVQVLRAPVDSLTLQSGAPGAELSRLVASKFAADVRELSLMGRLDAVRVSPDTPVPFIYARSRGSFVAEGEKIPSARPTFGTTTTLRPKAIKSTTMITKELARSSRAPDIIGRMMIDGTVEGSDANTLDSPGAASAARPASLVALAAEIYSGAGATDTDGADNLFRTMEQTFLTTGASFRRAAYLTSSGVCVQLAGLRTINGSLAFPTMTAAGGTIHGIPVYGSDYAAAETIVLVDGSAVILADEDTASIEVSDSATVYMCDDGSVPVSAFSADLLALKVVRELNWDVQGQRCIAATGLDLPTGDAATA